MLGANRKLKAEFIDMHCHILPGLDDGSKDLEESLSMLECAVNCGIKAIIVTPHFKNGRHNAGINTIMSRINTINEAIKEKGYLISLYPGNEIFYYDGLRDALSRQEVLTLNDTNRVLIEFSPLEQYTYIRNAMDDIVSAGYVPVLAHIERYQCLIKNPELAAELTKLGTEIQVNAASVAGDYGKEVQRFIFKLLEGKMITYVGTDAHDCKKRKPDLSKCYKVLKKKCSDEYINAIMKSNAEMLINI